MSIEMIKIYDEQKNPLGITSRDIVHQKGYWHDTFHCWFLKNENNIDYIYFQLRSKVKNDFPNLLDITAAGHILANETVGEGIREIKEELGMDVSMEDLELIGVIKDCIITENFIDKEFGNVYMYRVNEEPVYKLQKEEVSGIVRTKFKNFYDFVFEKRTEITVNGFIINTYDEKLEITKSVTKEDFVPHSGSYLKDVVTIIKNVMDC
ncbi:hydrolase [Niallia circulans]|uniref:NUDIX hydrolase n=2 Tax=Niallia circulans TaxID=1397 RepID=A0A0J1IRA0_NIACI|nr:NUDIX hydrolase [Niallia circulans]KLV28491.1 NUDIX hydrolase [Niallia circulans]MDR4315382.1 NUDIX hydrolase [Niallia circulans]MED3841698.1 NUDIX hydrolase [Niallia circulans]MED4245595.1 NUDIX hydrolase [Niallia circulans]MED4248271.1 NUDIX hydrolase [Niallia circulans]